MQQHVRLLTVTTDRESQRLGGKGRNDNTVAC